VNARPPTSPQRRRRPVADAWGVDDGYEDARGLWRDTSAATRRAIIGAMGGDPDAPSPVSSHEPRVWVRGRPAPVSGPGDLVLEDGTSRPVDAALPDDVPLGYHRFHRGEDVLRLIVAPARCHVPAHRAWGWAVQLYAARSAASWGIGDFRDLQTLAGWAHGLGAGFLLLNPLSAATPVLPQEPSPYFPSSRRFKNLLYLSVEDIPGAAELGPELDRLATQGRRLNNDRRIDRDAVLTTKLIALDHLWKARGQPTPGFDAYRAEVGEALEQFATFCALAERYGRSWPAWPSEFRHPASPAVRRFATELADRVSFHAWIQWLLDDQFARASRCVPGVQDLAIGIAPDGADAWAWQAVLARDVEVGAPPDLFNPGQRWGLPPFVPYRLAEAGYEPFIQTVRMSLRHAAGLRIDHVMGLFRLFWIPRGSEASDGAFVRYQADTLLGIVALESARATAFVVGEDLGTVEEVARERLDAAGILSYRLLWFETVDPRRYPRQALAAVTTHDLPTIRGLWSDQDVRTQRRLGLQPNERALRDIRRRLTRMAGLSRTARPERVITRLHGLLGRTSALLRAATLEDGMGVVERPNMPGADPSWPNWSLALPQPIEALEGAVLARTIAAVLGEDKRDHAGHRLRRQRSSSGKAGPDPTAGRDASGGVRSSPPDP
jgi:4-alpha-glucanotransferase